MGTESQPRKINMLGVGSIDGSRSLTEGATRADTSCGGCDCPHRQALRDVLGETIETLEQTRKSFKSKQIEALRKRLTAILLGDV